MILSKSVVHVWKKWENVILESQKWNSCPDGCQSRRLFNRVSWKKHWNVIFWWKLMNFQWYFWAKVSYTCEKSGNWWFLIEKVKNRPSSRSTKSLRNWLQKIWVNLEGFLLVVREKSGKRNRCNFFHTCTRLLHQHFVTFRTCRQRWKLIMLWKQKRNISWKKSAKCGKWQKFLHLVFVFCDSDENGFSASSRPNLVPNQRFH